MPRARIALSPDERAVFDAVFWSHGCARQALPQQLGFSRSKANALVSALCEEGVLDESGLMASTGGRRAEGLTPSDHLGVVLGCDLGATSLEVAVMRPDLRVLARHAEAADVRASPGVVLPRVRALLKQLLAGCGLTQRDVIAIGMGVPGPVDFASGQLVMPPLMPQWDGYSIRDALREDFPAAPVFVDNDVNLMALGELWRVRRQLSDFLVVKVGTGIGCGIVCHGAVYRGANGSAGDVGHILVDANGPLCHCGNRGCVEAMAAGPAIARSATEAANAGESALLAELLARHGALTPEHVAEACQAGDAAANSIVQRAGRLVGQMLAATVNFFNPSHLFIAGGVTRTGPLFLAAVRQSVYQRSLALSTRHLAIELAPLGAEGGLIGAGVLAVQEAVGQGLKRS